MFYGYGLYGFRVIRVGGYRSLDKGVKLIRVKVVRDYGLRVSIISFKGFEF